MGGCNDARWVILRKEAAKCMFFNFNWFAFFTSSGLRRVLSIIQLNPCSQNCALLPV